MEHSNKIAMRILIDQYGDYLYNKHHYDREYAMLIKAQQLIIRQEFIGCLCNGIMPQSKECYEQQIMVKVPNKVDIRTNDGENKKKEFVCIDPCLAAEIVNLWRLGIVTTGCCCGHNIPNGLKYIGVEDRFIPVMKQLGYKVAINPLRPNDEDSFLPKSV